MKIQTHLPALLAILVLSVSACFARPVPPSPTVSDLLSASVIIVGDMRGFLPNDDAALVAIRISLKGKISKGEVIVRGVQDLRHLPLRSVVRQWLAPGKTYVMFLRSDDSGRLTGINDHEFAIEMTCLPVARLQGVGAKQGLRLIAKANIASTNERLATRWCHRLCELYEKEDNQFFIEKLDDDRLSIRGCAICALCQHGRITPSLYKKAMAFLDETVEISSFGMLRVTISQLLGKALDADALRESRLRTWLSGKVPELQTVALGYVRQKRNVSMLEDVVALLERTSSVSVQYECIKTICVIERKPGPGYTTFIKDPNRYITEALKAFRSRKD